MNNEQKDDLIGSMFQKSIRLAFDLGYAQGIAAAVLAMLTQNDIDKDAMKELIASIVEIVV